MKAYRVLVIAGLLSAGLAPSTFAQDDPPTVTPTSRAPARQLLTMQEAMRYDALSVRAKRSAQEEAELHNLSKVSNDRVAEYLVLSQKTTRTDAEDERLETLRNAVSRNAVLRNINQQPTEQSTEQPKQLGSVRPLAPGEEAGLLIKGFRDSLRRSGDAVQRSQAADVTQIHLSALLIQQNDQIIQLLGQIAAKK